MAQREKTVVDEGQRKIQRRLYQHIENDRGQGLVEDIRQYYPEFEEIILKEGGALYIDAKDSLDQFDADFFDNARQGDNDLGHITHTNYNFTPDLLNILYDHGDEEYSDVVVFLLEEYFETLKEWDEEFRKTKKRAKENNQRGEPVRTSSMKEKIDYLKDLGLMEHLSQDYRDIFSVRELLKVLNHNIDSEYEVVDLASLDVHRAAELQALEAVNDLPEDHEKRTLTRYSIIDYLTQDKDLKTDFEDHYQLVKEIDIDVKDKESDQKLLAPSSSGSSEDED